MMEKSLKFRIGSIFVYIDDKDFKEMDNEIIINRIQKLDSIIEKYCKFYENIFMDLKIVPKIDPDRNHRIYPIIFYPMTNSGHHVVLVSYEGLINDLDYIRNSLIKFLINNENSLLSKYDINYICPCINILENSQCFCCEKSIMIDMELDPKQYSRQLMRYCENDYYTKLYIDIKRKGVLNEFNKTYKE